MPRPRRLSLEYATALLVLQEAKVRAGTDFIVCMSADYPEVLSASATGNPFLPVNQDDDALPTKAAQYVKAANTVLGIN